MTRETIKMLETVNSIQREVPDAAPLRSQSGVPDGWKLVPAKPTKEMLDAGVDGNPTSWTEGTDYGFPRDVASDVYQAMLEVAPTPVIGESADRDAIAWPTDQRALAEMLCDEFEGETGSFHGFNDYNKKKWLDLAAFILALRPTPADAQADANEDNCACGGGNVSGHAVGCPEYSTTAGRAAIVEAMQPLLARLAKDRHGNVDPQLGMRIGPGIYEEILAVWRALSGEG